LIDKHEEKKKCLRFKFYLFSSDNNLIQRRSMSNEGNVKSFDIQYKVLLLGDTQVGKTSLQRSIMGRDFQPSIGSTFGINRNF
jgi:GTPase SAR1 family protein